MSFSSANEGSKRRRRILNYKRIEILRDVTKDVKTFSSIGHLSMQKKKERIQNTVLTKTKPFLTFPLLLFSLRCSLYFLRYCSPFPPPRFYNNGNKGLPGNIIYITVLYISTPWLFFIFLSPMSESPSNLRPRTMASDFSKLFRNVTSQQKEDTIIVDHPPAMEVSPTDKA